MQYKKRENCHDSVGEGNRNVRHRHARKVGDYKRYDKFKRLHFADLPFAHKPHYRDEGDKNYKRSYKGYYHTFYYVLRAEFYAGKTGEAD